jgi:hypothetical protein
MATQHRIRSAFFHEGKSISVIAREFDIDRKTVRKYIERDDLVKTIKGDCQWLPNTQSRKGGRHREGLEWTRSVCSCR